MNMDYIIEDYITGKPVRNIGPEASRQLFEKFLVDDKGYDKTDIVVDEKIVVQFKGEDYVSKIDLIVSVDSTPLMAVTCVAGSIGSFEREILSGARLVYDIQIPFAITTDARDAIILYTLTGKKRSQGLNTIPSKTEAIALLPTLEFKPIDPDRIEKEMIIYRSFNLEKVNI
jgi:hypothetical protein